SSAVYHVVEGSGRTRIGDGTLEWKRGDTFAIPAWMPYVHSADEKTYFFRFDDRPLLEAIGAYRAAALEFPDADLRAHAPRSPYDELGGVVLLARTIDKTKAKLQGTLGAYKVTPGLSGYLFDWLGIAEDDFTQAVRQLRDDEAIANWVRTKSDPSKFAEVNQKLTTRSFRDAEHRNQFVARYPLLGKRPDLQKFFDLIEVDDQISFTR
ncbi:MAG: DUF5069 domain-containing protein, partial [Vulcanimicrobiaceae bacterium]